MKVLVVAKTTNLELHGETVRRGVQAGILREDYLQDLERDHVEHYRTLRALLAELARVRIEAIEIGRGHFWPKLDDLAAVITVGGDGTILEASHHIKSEPVLLIGIRSTPSSVGHLCAGGIERIPMMVAGLRAQELVWLAASRLQAQVQHGYSGGREVSDPILNDFLFANAMPAATTRYRLAAGEECEQHKSSGVWISTAVGSTGATAAAGGKRVTSTSGDFQYVVREPYHPPGGEPLTLRQGFFDPDRERFVIENLCDRAILAVDGQHGVVQLAFGDQVVFGRAPSVRLARRIA